MKEERKKETDNFPDADELDNLKKKKIGTAQLF